MGPPVPTDRTVGSARRCRTLYASQAPHYPSHPFRLLLHRSVLPPHGVPHGTAASQHRRPRFPASAAGTRSGHSPRSAAAGIALTCLGRPPPAAATFLRHRLRNLHRQHCRRRRHSGGDAVNPYVLTPSPSRSSDTSWRQHHAVAARARSPVGLHRQQPAGCVLPAA